ncbi:MAG: biopolymer transporter ExbD [Myxococcales bacterium]|nr:biopolymer transporter ExbD [Myxococcales bacterium]
MRREIAEAEDAEHEGGELNLVPYLDIVVNTVIFMLATSALSLTLGNINITTPRYTPPSAGAAGDDNQDDKPELNLTVGITYTGFQIGGSTAILPKIPCRAALRRGRCPAFLASRVNNRGEKEVYWVDKYNYKELSRKLREIKLFKKDGKYQFRHERKVILTADRNIPYHVVVKTMDTLRGKATKACTGDDNCLFDQVILSAGVQ